MKQLLVCFVLLSLLLAGCAPQGTTTESASGTTTESAAGTVTGTADASGGTTEAPVPAVTTENTAGRRATFVATLFPQYDFARTIAGEFADVVLIVPPGVEPHSYEPTPQDIVTMNDALAIFFTNEAMEPWMERLASTIDADKVDLSVGIELHEADHEDHDADNQETDSQDDHDHDHDVDPHYWLDPANAKRMAESVLYTMIHYLPEFEMQLRSNAAPLLHDLEKLDAHLAERTSKLSSRTIVTGGHFAFGYFAEKYGLTAVSPFEGLSPDAEPSAQNIAEVIDYVREHGVKAIYHEELLDPKIAQMIANETDAKLIQLHAAHNVSKEELQSGLTYIDIMLQTMKNLEEGLGVQQ